MHGYIERALQRFAHPKPRRPEDAPHAWIAPAYGKHVQYAPEPDASAFLDLNDKNLVQQIIGVILFYARAVDDTFLVALSELATAPTEATMKAITRLLNYAATHPDASILFRASDMILYVDSDASYLSVSKARSRVAGYFYLGH